MSHQTEQLQKTLDSLNTAVTLIEQMREDIAVLRVALQGAVDGLESASSGFTESNWEEEIARGKLALEMTARE